MSPLKTTLSMIQTQARHWLQRIVNQKWFDVGLRAKMSLMVVVGLSGLLAVFALMGINTARQTTRQVLSERILIARLSAAQLDATIDHVHSMLMLLAEQPVLKNPDTSRDEMENSLNRALVLVDGLYVLDKDSKLLASSKNSPVFSAYDSPAIQKALQGGSYHIAILPRSSNNQDVFTIVTVPVWDTNGNPGKVLAALINLSQPAFFPNAVPFDLGPTSTLDVVDASGTILISSEPERTLTNSQDTQVVHKLFISGRPSAETCIGCYGEDTSEYGDEVIAYAPLSEAPWGIVVRQSGASAFAPVHQISTQVGVLAIASFLGALALVWVTTNSVIEPVSLLTQATQRIANGDLELPLEATQGRYYRRDEIGLLANSLNSMRERLKQSIQEIKDWNQELDERVQERTQAARAAQMEAQAARDDLRAIIDALSDELVVIDTHNKNILQVNKAALEHKTGDFDLIGMPCYEALRNGHSCQVGQIDCPLLNVMESGAPARATHVYDCMDEDEKRYFDVVASPMRNAQGEITRIVELKRDVTEEQRMRASLEKRNQQLAILNSIANTVNQSLDLETILGYALDEVLRLTEIDAGAVFLIEEVLGRLRLMAYRGFSEEAANLAAEVGMLDGSCGGVIERGEIVVVPDLQRYRGHRARSLQREKLSTLVHVPLMVKGSTLGSMCVGTRQPRSFPPDDQELLTAIGSQIAVAIENARLYAEVQHKEHVRGELFKKAINAQEEERKRIARDLHDDTSQSLTALLYACEEAVELEKLDEINKLLGSMRDLTQHTLDGVHKIIFDLRPSMLDHLGLVPALRWLAKSRLEPKGVRVSVEETGKFPRLPSELETALFRVVQEAVSNIARHAAARNVIILLQHNPDGINVIIEDDGIGFETSEIDLDPYNSRGLGLLGMRERLELLGGSLEINTTPGQGTSLHINVPGMEESIVYG